MYLDASAATKLVIEEAESGALEDFVRGRALLSSRVVMVEVMKAVARANPVVDPHVVFAKFSFVELDSELALIAGATGGPGLRSLDAIHVASALRAGAEVEMFITYDARQGAVASAVGLIVATPGDLARAR